MHPLLKPVKRIESCSQAGGTRAKKEKNEGPVYATAVMGNDRRWTLSRPDTYTSVGHS